MIESVLRRKVLRPRSAERAAAGSSLARALPRALLRAFAAAASLTAQTGVVADRILPLAEALDLIDDDGFLALLAQPGQSGPGALAILDAGLFAALIEALTMGRLGPAPVGPPRRPTATDAALLGAVIDRLLADLDRDLRADRGLAAGGEGEGPWQMARGLADPRLLGAILDDGPYRLAQVPVVLADASGGTGRAGRLGLLVPVPQGVETGSAARGGPARGGAEKAGTAPAEAAAGVAPDAFGPAFETAVQAAPVLLTAVLGRVSLPLERALGLAVGQRLELPLAALEEVGLVGLDGQVHALARLGQSRGMRAVRILSLDAPAPLAATPTACANTLPPAPGPAAAP